MSLAADSEARIRRFASHAELAGVLRRYAEGVGDDLWQAGKLFEYLVIRAFELEGDEVRYPYHVTARAGGPEGKLGIIEQIDGAVYVRGLSVLVESKDYGEPIDIEPIAKLRFRLERRPPGTFGLVFARSGLTEPASYLLRNTPPKNILVWQDLEIEEALARRAFVHGLVAKHRHAVEYGLPDYSLLEEFTT